MDETLIHLETDELLKRDVQQNTFRPRDQTIILDFAGWSPEGDRASSHTSADMKVQSLAVNTMRARIEELLEPEQFRQIRKLVALKEVEAGDLIGGGPKAFSKYKRMKFYSAWVSIVSSG